MREKDPQYIVRREDAMQPSRTGVKQRICLARKFVSSFGRIDSGLHFCEKSLNDAVKLVKANARTVRRMLVLDLVIYRKTVGEQEYFLRRITTLSVYLLLFRLCWLKYPLIVIQENKIEKTSIFWIILLNKSEMRGTLSRNFRHKDRGCN